MKDRKRIEIRVGCSQGNALPTALTYLLLQNKLPPNTGA